MPLYYRSEVFEFVNHNPPLWRWVRTWGGNGWAKEIIEENLPWDMIIVRVEHEHLEMEVLQTMPEYFDPIQEPGQNSKEE